MNYNKINKSLLSVAIVGSLTLLSGCNDKSESTPVSQDSKQNNELTQQQGSTNQPTNNLAIWPTLNLSVKKDDQIEAKIAQLIKGMTLEQKVAQMIQPEIRDITVEDMRKYGFGSYLNGGGSFPQGNKQATPQEWIDLAESMYQASIDDSLDGSSIPTMWGTDAVHGHNNVIGATLFPHNIGLGAANNPALIEQIAAATAKEVMVTGIDWVFAPTVAVVRDDRWGRTYEGYSEDPEIVRDYSASIVKGLQGAADEDFLSDQRVISTVKHFLGDGGTVDGDDQGNNIDSEQDLFNIHAQGYIGGLSAGSQSVMASFNSWHGKKNHGNKYLLTDVLKTQMGFDGFVVGDWNGHGQVKGCSNESCPQSVNAGLDMYMVPTGAWKPLYENTIAQVRDGQIAQSRIDDAVARILRVKLRAGLFEKPSPANRQFSGKTELIGAKAHRDIAQQAVRESLVLLKNKNKLLPLSPKLNVLVAGDGANNIGKQTGGWTITWQGTGNKNEDFPGSTSIFKGIADKVKLAGGSAELSLDGSFKQRPDVAIVVFGEDPYAEGHGDRDNLDYQRGNKTDLALLNSLKAKGIPVVSLFISGRPMWVNAELNASDAFVAIWLPGSEGQGVADVLFSENAANPEYDFVGKLSFSWPKSPYQTMVNKGDADYEPLLPYGFGLRYADENVLPDTLNETVSLPDNVVTKEVFFDGKMHKPWLMWLFSENELLQPSANTHKLSGLSYRTVDRVVQEDAVQLSISSNNLPSNNLPSNNSSEKLKGIRLVSKSNFREDLLSATEVNSALHFSINVVNAPSSQVLLSTKCQLAETEHDNCGASLDITKQLQNNAGKGWQDISVDLACLSKQGMRFGSLVAPFELATTGDLTVQLTDISYLPNSAKAATISCQ